MKWPGEPADHFTITKGNAHGAGRNPRKRESRMDIMTQWNIVASWMRARFGQDERGASLVEYALLVALIAVVCIGAVGFLGGEASSKFSEVGSKIN